jgi:hypothetical protein
VWAATRPRASTIPACRRGASGSEAISSSSASRGDFPAASSSSPRGPQVVLAKACVATAPIPAFAQGTTAPTAKNFDCTATPTSPVDGSAPTIEKVATGSPAGAVPGARTSAASTGASGAG